jgi:hypothetical protein
MILNSVSKIMIAHGKRFNKVTAKEAKTDNQNPIYPRNATFTKPSYKDTFSDTVLSPYKD